MSASDSPVKRLSSEKPTSSTYTSVTEEPEEPEEDEDGAEDSQPRTHPASSPVDDCGPAKNGDVDALLNAASGTVEVKNPASVLIAFLIVGSGCGWFVVDADYQLLANVPETQRGGKMFGTFTAMSGFCGLGLATVYFLYLTFSPVKLSFRGEQVGVACIIVCSTTALLLLSFGWGVGPPDYPVVQLTNVIGNLVANATYFLVFPLISTYYGGWLVAPVRAGTDVSALLTSILAELENPTGTDNKFPPEYLFLAYAVISMFGLVAWWCVVRFEIGLLKDRRESGEISVSELSSVEEDEDRTEESRDVSSDVEEREGALGGKPRDSAAGDAGAGASLGALLRLHCGRLACARVLAMPVAFGVLVASMQWSFVVALGPIAAKMMDPSGCDGPDGRWVFRQAVTLNRCLLPISSMASALVRCPRRLFMLLTLLQVCAAFFIVAVSLGFARASMSTEAGQYLFIVMNAVVGCLDGFVFTTAYRYIGETPGVPAALRHSTSNLMGILAVAVVNPLGILAGSLVSSGSIRCTDPL